jgi:hypothetical protein
MPRDDGYEEIVDAQIRGVEAAFGIELDDEQA